MYDYIIIGSTDENLQKKVNIMNEYLKGIKMEHWNATQKKQKHET